MAKVTVTLVPSKASLEIEQEKREARQRLLELERETRAQARPQPRPLKSCLKKPSSPQSQELSSSYGSDGSDLKRHVPSTRDYHFDAERHHGWQRSRTYPIQQQAMPSYPSDTHPCHPERQSEHHHHRSKSQVSSESTTPRINKANYVKASYKEVPMKDEAIALSWQLVDYETRCRKPYPAVYFDAAFDPRLVGYEIKVLRYGETRWAPMLRDEETQLVFPHAFMTDMIIIHPTLAQWPVYVWNPRGIRCIDVFRAIYDTYSIPLSQDEIEEWGPEYIERCKRVFEQRCEEGPRLPQVTRVKGICRVDLLRGEKIFKGLVPYKGPRIPGISPSCCWTLNLERRRSSR
ncbi:hypothetical protein CC2G_012510 [Coprinopsis cinerea AmutBmut pab1-1]|nr:hypothetical protein CC2G_012510 [Coprinopsis cinerea AmutBmut pab1-1]